jgi:hypothetical protein
MSKVLNIQGIELLRFNHAGAMQLKDGRTVNYGVIRINDQEIVYYTGKGIREMWKPNMTEKEKERAEELKKIGEEEGGELKLINSEHITVTPLDEIARVLF